MSEQTCSRCRLPIHPSETMRHMGRHVAHESSRCIELLKHKADAAAALAISAESKLDGIMKVIRHCAGESSFDSCNYRADSKPYCTECQRHDYEGHDEMCWRRLAFEEPPK